MPRRQNCSFGKLGSGDKSFGERLIAPCTRTLKELKAYKAGSGCMSIEVIKRGIVPVLGSALCVCSDPAEYLGIIFTRPLVRIAKSTQEELHGLDMKVLRIVQEAC